MQLYQLKVQSIKWLILDRQRVQVCPLAVSPVVWLEWVDLASVCLTHFRPRTISPLSDPPTISFSYDYFIILNSLCHTAVALYPLQQSGGLAIQYIHTTVIWMALRCGSVPVPQLDSARPLVPSVPSCAVCEGPVDAKTIGISLEQPEGRCPELLAANDVHLLWQNKRGWEGGGSKQEARQETAALSVLQPLFSGSRSTYPFNNKQPIRSQDLFLFRQMAGWLTHTDWVHE